MCDCQSPAEGQIFLRLAGAVTMVLSLGQFIAGLIVYNAVTSPKLGAWWAAIVIFVSGVLGVISLNRGVVIATMTVGVSE
jgi:uncharacterized membrane protein